VSEIIKISKNLGTLLIKQIDRKQAKEMIIDNHYSHKWNGSFGIYNFGIFKAEEPNKCLGCSCFGYMKNPRAKIFTHPNPQAWLIELNRLWISDCLGKNAETILIAASFKLLKELDKNIVAVQSFADGRLGCGTIYKASNFKYYGFHYSKFFEHRKTGEIIQEQILTDGTSKSGYIKSNINLLLNEYKVFKVKTYRYIYSFDKHFKFTGTKEQPYPAYDKGIEYIDYTFNKEKVKQRLIEMIEKL
jgi:hypothetical protein